MNLLEKFAEVDAASLKDPLISDWFSKIDHHIVMGLRKWVDIRQEDVAKRLGIPRAHIIAIEAGTMPIPLGYRSFLLAAREHARKPWGHDANAFSFPFVNEVTLYSEWVIDGQYHVRYLIAQTKAKMMLDPADKQMDITFGLFATDGETAEASGPFRGAFPQSVREAEKQLIAMGAEKITTYPAEELLSESQMNARQEGAEVSIANILDEAFKKIAAKEKRK